MADHLRVAIVDAGGFSPAYDYALFRALRVRGVDATLFTTRAALLDFGVQHCEAIFPSSVVGKRRGVRYRARLVLKGIQYAFALYALLRMLRAQRPDIIHWQWLPLPVFDRLALAACCRIAPVVFTLHDSMAFNGSATSRLQVLGLSAAVKSASQIIVHSEFGKRQASASGQIDRAKIQVVPHGAFDHYQNRVRKVEAKSNVILLIGSIKPYKGAADLLKAFAAVNSEVRTGWKLVIAGWPSMPTDELTTSSVDLGLQGCVDFEFREFTEDEFAQRIAEAAIVVLPYREIDQSGVLMSALALGATIIATRVGAFEETLGQSDAGVLVAPENVKELTAAISNLILNSEERRRLATNAAKLAASTLTWTNVANMTESVYRALLDQKEHEPG